MLTPFLQAPATKLAEKLHFDTLLSERWEPLIQWLSDLSSDPWYIFASGLVTGFAVGLWVDAVLRSRERRANAEPRLSAQASPEIPIATRALLRLRFSGRFDPPEEIVKENIRSWFAYWTPNAHFEDQNGSKILEVPASWAIFITFERPVTYRQLSAHFTGARPTAWQVRQALPTVAVLTIDGGMPECELEVLTRA